MVTRVKRRLRLADARPDAELTGQMVSWLSAQDAVLSCRTRGRVIELEYDPLRLDLESLLRSIEAMGLFLDDGWLQRWRRAWYLYQDEALRENAAAPPPACCNKPPRRME